MARRDNAVRRAIERVGGITMAAAICGVRERTMGYWQTNGRIPDLRAALRLAAKTGLDVRDFSPGWDEKLG